MGISDNKLIVLLFLISVFGISLVSAGIYWGDETNVNFDVTGDEPYCNAGVSWINPDGIEEDSQDNCYMPDNEINAKTCCEYPEETCNTNTGECELEVVNFCEEYTNENDCENYNDGVADATIERSFGVEGVCNNVGIYEDGCTKWLSSCKCVWNEDAEEGKKCQSAYDVNERCPGDGDKGSKVGTCNYAVAQILGDCDEDDEMTYFINATWTGSSSAYGASQCVDKSQPVPCADSIIKLPVFGFMNFILVCLGIIGFYIFKRD